MEPVGHGHGHVHLGGQGNGLGITWHGHCDPSNNAKNGGLQDEVEAKVINGALLVKLVDWMVKLLEVFEFIQFITIGVTSNLI